MIDIKDNVVETLTSGQPHRARCKTAWYRANKMGSPDRILDASRTVADAKMAALVAGRDLLNR